MSDPASCAFQAFAALRFYTPLFPDDNLPFRAMAHVMSVHEPSAAADAISESYRGEITFRMKRLDAFIAQSDQSRGLLHAARYALAACEYALSDQPNLKTASEMRRKSFEAARGVGATLPD